MNTTTELTQLKKSEMDLWFSTLWQKRYTFGLFEWPLRSFPYWKWQSMKKTIQITDMAL